MAEQDDMGAGALQNGDDNAPQVSLIAQYVKDLSFENPNAPAVYQWQGQPRIDVQFNIGAQVVGEDVHEVALKIEVSAQSADKTAFHVELVYGALFGIRNLADDQIQLFLFAEAPRLMFPFARRIISDAIRDGNFQPLMLEPIDFGALYIAQTEAAQNGLENAEPVGQA